MNIHSSGLQKEFTNRSKQYRFPEVSRKDTKALDAGGWTGGWSYHCFGSCRIVSGRHPLCISGEKGLLSPYPKPSGTGASELQNF